MHQCLPKQSTSGSSFFRESFISTGFLNWKDAVAKLNKHEGSHCPKDAVLATVTLPATTNDVSELWSTQLAKDQSEWCKWFLNLLSNVRFLSKQGLAFHGDGDESDSNFMQLIQLCSEDDSRLSQWAMQKTDKHTSGEMQNDMIKVMALCVLRKISTELQACLFLTVMVDETPDASKLLFAFDMLMTLLKNLLVSLKLHLPKPKISLQLLLMCSSA